MRLAVALILSAAVPAALAAGGATLNVPSEQPTIQAAIDAAGEGDEVLVAAGTYEVTRPIVFRGKGVAVRSVAGPEGTTVRMGTPADPTRRSVFAFEGAEPPGALLEGFTITGGGGILTTVEFEALAEPALATAGGGVYCGPHAEPRLVRNIIRGNSAEYGGGVLCNVDSHPRFADNQFIENRTLVAPRIRLPGGGGLAALADASVVIEGGSFLRNSGVVGAGIFLAADSDGEVHGVRFEKNRADFHGGAMFVKGKRALIAGSQFIGNQSDGLPDGTGGAGGAIELDVFSRTDFLLQDCRFEGNRGQRGGGLAVETLGKDEASTATVLQCDFIANEVIRAGGGVYTEHQRERITLRSCWFERNAAPAGGGVFNSDGGETVLEGCIFLGNFAGAGGAVADDGSLTRITGSTLAANAAALEGGGVYVQGDAPRLFIESSILWANAGGSLRGACGGGGGAICTVAFSTIEESTVPPGEGNSNGDPRFEGWGTGIEVWVDPRGPGPGSGTEADPFLELSGAIAGYSLALAPDSPCIGTGAAGADRGAPALRAAAAGTAARLVHVAAGEYDLEGWSLSARVSLRGDGSGKTRIRGPVRGLRTGSSLEDLSVSGAAAWGGVVVGSGEAPELRRVRIIANQAAPGIFPPTTMGGLSLHGASPRLESCAIVGNRYGGLHALAGSTPSIVGTTITGNDAAGGGGGSGGGLRCQDSSPRLENSILWGNVPAPPSIDGDSRPEISYSVIESPALWPGEGNQNGDPHFLSAGHWDDHHTPQNLADDQWIDGDERLADGSPAIDAGKLGEAGDRDLDGDPRLCGAAPDLGAYERCAAGDPPFRRGDVDASGGRDVTDAVALLDFLFLGGTPPPCLRAADVDGDGVLAVTDGISLLNFLFLGGTPPPQPFADCGQPQAPTKLGCAEFSPCG